MGYFGFFRRSILVLLAYVLRHTVYSTQCMEKVIACLRDQSMTFGTKITHLWSENFANVYSQIPTAKLSPLYFCSKTAKIKSPDRDF